MARRSMIDIDEGLRMDGTTLAQAESVAEIAASTAADVFRDVDGAKVPFKARVAKVCRWSTCRAGTRALGVAVRWRGLWWRSAGVPFIAVGEAYQFKTC